MMYCFSRVLLAFAASVLYTRAQAASDSAPLWTVNVDINTTAPTVVPTTSTPMWRWHSGRCQIDRKMCLYSTNYPNAYDVASKCRFSVSAPATLRFLHYPVLRAGDALTVYADQWNGHSGPVKAKKRTVHMSTSYVAGNNFVTNWVDFLSHRANNVVVPTGTVVEFLATSSSPMQADLNLDSQGRIGFKICLKQPNGRSGLFYPPSGPPTSAPVLPGTWTPTVVPTAFPSHSHPNSCGYQVEQIVMDKTILVQQAKVPVRDSCECATYCVTSLGTPHWQMKIVSHMCKCYVGTVKSVAVNRNSAYNIYMTDSRPKTQVTAPPAGVPTPKPTVALMGVCGDFVKTVRIKKPLNQIVIKAKQKLANGMYIIATTTSCKCKDGCRKMAASLHWGRDVDYWAWEIATEKCTCYMANLGVSRFAGRQPNHISSSKFVVSQLRWPAAGPNTPLQMPNNTRVDNSCGHQVTKAKIYNPASKRGLDKMKEYYKLTTISSCVCETVCKTVRGMPIWRFGVHDSAHWCECFKKGTKIKKVVAAPDFQRARFITSEPPQKL